MRQILVFALALVLSAQDQRFGIQSRLVLAPVSVTDSNGEPVDNLTAADFRLLDNGRVESVTVDSFATGVAPIALVIAVQSAGISAAALEKVRKIGSMIQPLVTGERGCAALVAFDERIVWQQECTSDPDELDRAFQSLRPGTEKTARMLDAAADAIARLRARANVRRVLLLISESRDRGSETELAGVVADAQSAGVTVYATTYSAFATAFTTKEKPRTPMPDTIPAGKRPPPPPPPDGHEPVIPPPEQRLDVIGAIGELARLGKVNATETLAEATGGTTFSFTRQRGLEDAIQKLGGELHTQYVLSFAPGNRTPGYHKIEVQVTRRGKFQVRARPAYWLGAE